MSDLFSTLASALRPGEGLVFTINALAEGRIEVVLQPNMPDAPDLPDDAARLRAALAMPLRLTGTPAAITGLFEDRLAQYREARAQAADAFADLLGTLQQATAAARKEAAAPPSTSDEAASMSPDAPAPVPASSTPTADQDAPASNPTSLF